MSDEPYKEAHMLGICYLLGYGCQQDMALGRTLLGTEPKLQIQKLLDWALCMPKGWACRKTLNGA